MHKLSGCPRLAGNPRSSRIAGISGTFGKRCPQKGDRSGRRMGASPATKAMEPAQDRSCRTPTTGALRKFLRSDKSFSYFLRQNRDLYTSGPLTSSSPASRLAPIHFTLLPASAFSSLTGKPKILKSRRVKVNRCMAWFLLGRMKMGSST